MKTAGAAVALMALTRGGGIVGAYAQDAAAPQPGESAFDGSTVAKIARDLASRPFEPPPTDLPAELADLDYVQYRDITFANDQTIWMKEGLPFGLQTFHRGFFFKEKINISIVERNVARPLAYSPQQFIFGARAPQQHSPDDIGFAGFRLEEIGENNVLREFLVFLGASYFRSVGAGQSYGLSARGLALKTAAPEGEEFPIFRAFWLEKPGSDSKNIVIHALLDSPSVAGAYRFDVTPGDDTTMEVTATLFPRVDLVDVGLAPATSMFFFDANGRVSVDDYRPEVHDSDGLLIVNGAGERLWRPISNPKTLQVSAFVDTSTRGFGLIQRNRDFEAYQDFEAHYERRPSLWVEPIGDWGPGSVRLVEIPTDAEVHDNIVAFWTPQAPVAAGGEFSYAYRLVWGYGPDSGQSGIIVKSTRRGRASAERPTPVRLFVVDFTMADGSTPPPGDLPEASVTANNGKVEGVTVIAHPEVGGWRLTFQLDPEDAASVEMRAALVFKDSRPVETWLYRWTGD